MTPITDAELLEEYHRSDLQERGISFEDARSSETLRRAMAGAIRARRKLAARQAKAAAINYQIHDEEAA